MAAILENVQTSEQTKAEQLFSLLLRDNWQNNNGPILEMMIFMIDKYGLETCRLSSLPLLTHPLSVMQITADYATEYGCLNTDTIIASLGHDLLDDGKISDEILSQTFNSSVSKIIHSLTDYNKRFSGYKKEPSLDFWRTRKFMYITSLGDRLTQPWAKQMLLIAGADKLDNCGRITLESEQSQRNVWNTSITNLDWYYQTFIEFLEKNLGGSLSVDLRQAYTKMAQSLKQII